jgi:ABC-2 type transport system ATP-binding protein
MSIAVHQLTKHYGDQTAVDNISFGVATAGVTGFLGPNGAGKSTTMKILTGFLQPSAGSVRVCGVDVVAAPLKAKRLMGYLPESNALYADLYVREYLSFVGKLYKTPGLANRVATCVEMVGLQTEVTKKISQLSKGYKQRVGLAAALLHQPPVLILDEPTSGLDPNQIVEIRNLIKLLGQTQTVLLSTHIMQEVEAVCNHVVIINKGKLVANDTLQNLKRGAQAQALRVGFEEVLEPEWLWRLPGVEVVEKLDAHHWQLQGEAPADLRRQVLQWAGQQGLNITGMQVSGGSLEDIFRQLTTTEAPTATQS